MKKKYAPASVCVRASACLCVRASEIARLFMSVCQALDYYIDQQYWWFTMDVLNIKEMRILNVYKLHMLSRTLGEVIWLHRMILERILFVAFLWQYANEIMAKILIIEILSPIEILA